MKADAQPHSLKADSNIVFFERGAGGRAARHAPNVFS